MPGVPRRVADVGVGVEESVEGGVSRAMPGVPRRVADVGVGVEEIVEVHEVLRRFDDVGVGVEDNVVEVAEVEVAEVELANDVVAAIVLFPNASVKEDFIFRPTAVAAFTDNRSSYPHRMRIFQGDGFYPTANQNPVVARLFFVKGINSSVGN
jgi:hypothetical protein